MNGGFETFAKFYCHDCDRMFYVEGECGQIYGVRYCPLCGSEETITQGHLTFPKAESIEISPKEEN